jgi:predicted SprT family Zn-dependent metalloprotease
MPFLTQKIAAHEGNSKRPSSRYPIVARRSPSEFDLFLSVREAIRAAHPMQYESLDLGNDFYWMFRLSELLSQARRRFREVNEQFYADALTEPVIVFCRRTTGGYYNRKKHEIGISLAMTLECGEPEFYETLLHEVAHIRIGNHSAKFYAELRRIGGNGRKAPMTLLLAHKRKAYVETRYPVIVECPGCRKQQRYRTRRALQYACKSCCTRHAGGKFDSRFKFVEVRRGTVGPVARPTL